MEFDLESLNLTELRELNHKVVERIKFLQAMHTQNEMMQFNPGDQVGFQPPGEALQVGTLVKYNKKTVSVLTENGQKWNVPPQLLTKVKNVNTKNKKGGKLIMLK